MSAGVSARPVLDAIRGDIVDGGTPPGSVLEVDVLASAHDVSRIPVREALMTLVGEGLVEHQPRRGYTVTRLADGELSQLFAVRGTLELAALAVAVRLGGPDDVREANAAHVALQRAVVDGDEREYHRQSRAFHVALTRPSAMPRLLGVFDRVWDLTEPYRPMEDLGAEEAAVLHGEHTVMLEAFAAGDADRLLATAAEHQENLSTRVRSRDFSSQPAPAAPVRRMRRRTGGGTGVEEQQ
ncbi:MAG: GntR family transcriptional regulator [Janthinobacterium lividum]